MEKRQRTTLLTEKEAQGDRRWFLIDGTGKTVGRLASEIAKILRGKHKVTYTPYIDTGDGVIVVNAEKVKITGAKEAQKLYRYYTGFMSGLREIPYRIMRDRKPDYILRHAVMGMMPKTRLARKQLKKLRVFKGRSHSMTAQSPIVLDS